ncbi:bifunctional homocysteine S-methyltransferase/methylenetetrahydrofolate reductase [Paenibacillus albiflavus]|uniref:Bifunctional homocysteine S-methyltransferase/methylenetetrahydrofolate reductase n=1 Tax=Paenibacillus albiflavus TaxID=2545760 RepID=A0A4R4EH48_9BACL|nr:bifunctional homocysteine S-methyltransferase/methylenetetrahydrofolate reductase [Paenibacillus albiflavus]TCZ79434.1 bifunctional homocysteine S-methyltransferase/methylenetetrahydrofolate reductase [Paenibacillus albiflavus]
MKLDLRTALQSTVLVGDGAMGTLLYQQGFPVGISYEELNILHPEVIANVHKQYYDAGARVIETNTFSANREKLSKFGLENEVAAINKAGVELARQAVGSDAYVIGSIGSIWSARRINIRIETLEEAFKEQITALLEAGPDGLLLETFYHMSEMELALRLIREVSDIPVICQFATEGTMNTLDGVPLQDAFDRLAAMGADVIGFNCHIGPYGIMRTIEKITPPIGIPFSVFPNAGMPDYADGVVTFGATPGYFAECAPQFAALGAKIIGGCCGTTPEHIAAIAQALSGVDAADTAAAARPKAPSTESAAVAEKPAVHEQQGEVSIADVIKPPAKPTLLDIVKQRHTVIVELDPPRDLDISKFMRGAQALKDAGADAVTMADNSLAVTRMSNMALGQMVQAECGARPLIHIAGRDRNLIGTQSHLMGLDALGIDHVLAVTGDPSRFGDLPGSSSVYDLSSFDMIRLIKQLNEGIAFSGKPLKRKANFRIGAALNPNVKLLDKAIQRMERKISLGADYIMTQPIYDPALIERLYESTKHLDIPIFVGIMPLASGRNAEYLHNEVPGIVLSDDIRKRMTGLEGAEGRKVGVEIAKELLDVTMHYFKGIYLITPFLYYEMSTELTKYVWEKASACTAQQNELQ